MWVVVVVGGGVGGMTTVKFEMSFFSCKVSALQSDGHFREKSVEGRGSVKVFRKFETSADTNKNKIFMSDPFASILPRC